MGEKARWIFHACRRRAFVFFCTSYLFFGLILHDDIYRGNDGKIIRRVIFNEKKGDWILRSLLLFLISFERIEYYDKWYYDKKKGNCANFCCSFLFFKSIFLKRGKIKSGSPISFNIRALNNRANNKNFFCRIIFLINNEGSKIGSKMIQSEICARVLHLHISNSFLHYLINFSAKVNNIFNSKETRLDRRKKWFKEPWRRIKNSD